MLSNEARAAFEIKEEVEEYLTPSLRINSRHVAFLKMQLILLVVILQTGNNVSRLEVIVALFKLFTKASSGIHPWSSYI